MNNIKHVLILVFLLFALVGCVNSKLPEQMPEDFSFSIYWGFDGEYDSSTKVLSNGFNYDLNIECKTELELSKEQLKEVYEIIKKAKIDTFDEVIKTKYEIARPSSDLKIIISYGNEKYTVTLLHSNLNDDMDKYLNGKQVGKAIKQIVENYIISSDEFKSLPENQLLYE